MVTDKFSISSGSHLTKACYSLVTHLETSPSFLLGKVSFCPAIRLEQLHFFFFFFRKELPKSCNYHFIFVRQKPVGALDLIFLLVLVGRFGGEVSVGVLGTAILFEPLTASLVDLNQ